MFKVLQLFQHDIAIQVLYGLMGYSVLSPACSEMRFEAVEGTTISVAELHTYVATVITCLRAGESEYVDGHRQTLYNNIFYSFVPASFAQMVQRIGAGVEK